MPQLPLTIIILTNRTDACFEQALASAQVAQEVIVVDNNSANNWELLKGTYHFITIPYPDSLTDFSYVRNMALDAASNDWVLFLDSDETLSDKSLPELAMIIDENKVDGVVVQRSDVFYGKKLEYGEAGNQPLVRMGKKAGIRFVGKVHEKAEVHGIIHISRIEILHYSHPTISEFISKVSHYAEDVARERAEQPISWGMFLLQLLLFPPAKFFDNLIIKGGSQDGWQGVVYAACMSLHSLLVRIYLYEKQYLELPR